MFYQNKIVRTIAAIIIGEIVLVLLTTVAQAVLYDGITWNESPTQDLIFGGLATIMAAVITGIIISYIGGKNNSWPPSIISLLICIETTYIITSGMSNDPVWFDVGAGFSLVIGIWVGYFFRKNIL